MGHLDVLPWTRRTGRRDELGLVEERRHELVALLNGVWPEWGDVPTFRPAVVRPDFWAELLDTKGSPGEWPAEVDISTAPRWFDSVDPRAPAALEEML